MASYLPPSENLPIFDNSVFTSITDEPLTYDIAKKLFLTYPYAQGTENLKNTHIGGTLDISDGSNNMTLIGNAISSNNGITFTDTQAVSFSHIPKATENPTAWENNDLATVGYVQSQLGQSAGGINLYLNQSIASSVSPYKVLSNTATNVATQSVITTALGTGTLISEFLTVSGYPNIATLSSGIWVFSIFGNRSNTGTGNLYYYAELYSYTNLGVQTLIATSGNSRDVNGSTTAPDCVQIAMSVPTTILNLTDRLAVKIYSTGTGMSGSVTLTTYFEGSYYSYVSTSLSIPPPIPTISQVLTAGNNAGNQNILGVGSLVVGTGLSQVVAQSSIPSINLSDGTNTIIIDDSVPSISISNGLITNTINSSGILSTLDTGSTSRPLLFTNNSTTGTQALLKSSGLTYTPSTSTLTCTNFNGLVANATTAQTITLTSDDTSGTYYIPFSKTTAGTNSTLYIDDTTTALSYNPSLSALYLDSVNATTTNTTTTNTNNLIVNSTSQVPTVAYPNNSTTIASTGYVSSAISAIPNLLTTNNQWSGTNAYNNNVQVGPTTTNITNLISSVGATISTGTNPISSGAFANYTYYLFSNTGSGFSFTYTAQSSQNITFNYVIIGAGGAGSGVAQGNRINAGAGGGGGQVKSGSFVLSSSGTVNITVGSGGSASYTTAGNNGGSTILSGSVSDTALGGFGGSLGTTLGVGGQGGNNATGTAIGGIGGTSGSTSGGNGSTVSNSSSGAGGSYYTVINSFASGGTSTYTFPVDGTTASVCNGGNGGGIVANLNSLPSLSTGYGSGGNGAICYNDKPSHSARNPQGGQGGCVLIYFLNTTTITPTTSYTFTSSSAMNITNLTDSTSSSTGALIVSGGVSSGKNITSNSYSFGYTSLNQPALTSANIGWFSNTSTSLTNNITTASTSQKSISLPVAGTYIITYAFPLTYAGTIATSGYYTVIASLDLNALTNEISGSRNSVGIFAFNVTNCKFGNTKTFFYTSTSSSALTIYLTSYQVNASANTYTLDATASVSFMRIA